MIESKSSEGPGPILTTVTVSGSTSVRPESILKLIKAHADYAKNTKFVT